MRERRWLAIGALLVLFVAAGCSDARSTAAPVDADELAVSVASFDLAVGDDRRFLAGVMTPDRQVIGGGRVAMSFARLPDGGDPLPAGEATATFLPVPGTGTPADLDEPVVLGAPAAHDHGPGAEPHDHGEPSAAGVYEATVDLDRPGFWQVTVTAIVDGDRKTGSAVFDVVDESQVPAVGDPAPRVHTLTLDSDAPAAAIDSRAGPDQPVPDPALHQTDLVDALDAGRPVVLAFTTPTYCTSRFCGPITDRVEALAHRYADRAAFVHVEIWRDMDTRTLNDAVEPWIGTDDGGNEPWVFLIGADGTVAGRWDNVLDEDALVAQLEALPPT